MDEKWGKVFVLDLRPVEEIATDYPLPDRFLKSITCHFQIDKGYKEERTHNLKSAIDEICRVANDTIITLHVLGHGVVFDEVPKDSIGIQFLKWDEFAAIIGKPKRYNVVFINMLSVCFSNGFVSYENCYDKIWYTNTKAESIEIPTEIYWDNYFNDFESYLKKNDGTGYFGFSIKSNE